MVLNNDVHERIGKQEAQGPYRSPEYHATKNAFNLNACYNHMPNS